MRISDWSFRRVLFRSIARARDGIRVAIIHFDDGAGDHAIADIAIITRHRDIAAGAIIFEGRVVALRFLHLELWVARAAAALDVRIVRMIDRSDRVERADISAAERDWESVGWGKRVEVR